MPDPGDEQLKAQQRKDTSLGGSTKSYSLAVLLDAASRKELEMRKRVMYVYGDMVDVRGFGFGPDRPLLKDTALVNVYLGLSGHEENIRRYGEPVRPMGLAASMKSLHRAFVPYARTKTFEGPNAKETSSDMADAYGFLAAPGEAGKPSRLMRLAGLIESQTQKPSVSNVKAVKSLWAEIRPKLDQLFNEPSNAKLLEVYAAFDERRRVTSAQEPAKMSLKDLVFDRSPELLLRELISERLVKGSWK